MTYSEIEGTLLKIEDSQLPEIFHFDNTPHQSEFEQIFEFYSETLDLHTDYGISPSFLYFNNIRVSNAFAYRREDYAIVGINCGLILHLIETFKSKQFNIPPTIIQFELDTKIEIVMYQFCLHFTFYHEMAHLIQNSSLLSLGLSEMNNSNESFIEQKHLLELDADQFSSLSLGQHIIDYYNRLDPSLKNKEIFEYILIISIASILIYLYTFSSATLKLYLKENSHPHPAIRITNILGHIMEYTHQNLYGSNCDGETMTRVLSKASDLVSMNVHSDIVNDYFRIVITEMKAIKEYLAHFNLKLDSDNTLASNKWNEMAKNK